MVSEAPVLRESNHLNHAKRIPTITRSRAITAITCDLATFYFAVNLSPYPTPPPSTPKNIDLHDSTPGSPQNPVLVLWGGSPGLIFLVSGFEVYRRALPILLLC